ncbi:MAG: 1-acyl-sn-glycerol-3-phosphate acyltransferase [Clostridia bacterium]|nr:1-acyl-sn-glycerol-3-phosphate acyltransferase [Clostridia bacterium]
MKIKTKTVEYSAVASLPPIPPVKPKKPGVFFRALMRIASAGDLKKVNFRLLEPVRPYENVKPPYLILMNHSSFTDLEMASHIFKNIPYAIICTSDGFVGKKALMRRLGCIPTEKFCSDPSLIVTIKQMLWDKRCSVLMYPEASYTFDGTATPLPRYTGALLKRLEVPVIMVRTYGAFQRDPLYNMLQKRKVDVSARADLLFTPEEIAKTPVRELDDALDKAFTYDHFAWQKENGIKVDELFRADGLQRILYKCPHCGAEGKTLGKGTSLECRSCGKKWQMDEYGELRAEKGDTEFSHIPAWYAWERDEVKKELESGTYLLDIPVKIGYMTDYKAIYMIGNGRLRHNADGFLLKNDAGDLVYRRSPTESHSLYADYYWYELGDMICVGKKGRQFYCFPLDQSVPVAKARLAAEELYKLKKERRI